MIRVKDIQEQNIENFHNWYDNPIISEIASITKHIQKDNLNKWFDQHTQDIKDQFGQFKKEILHQVDVLENHIVKGFENSEGVDQKPLKEI